MTREILGAWILVALASGSAAAQVRGDFNGDGIGDLAIGAPNEGLIANRVVNGVVTPTNIVNAGSVTVIFGAADGLAATTGTSPLLIHQDLTNVLDSVETNDRFGAALAAGDFNGDNLDDLVVSVPGDNAIQIFPGSSGGLDVAGDRMILGTQFVDNQNLPLTLQAGLARGNFNGDAFDDLAIEATELEGIGVRANAIVLYGSQQFGLQFTGLDIFAFNNAGLGGENTANTVDMTLAAGDFSNDGADDLAVALPLADVFDEIGELKLDAGGIVILQGIPGSVQTGGVVTAGFSQLNSMGFVVRDGEHFGEVLAVGDFDGDNRDDLAVGTPDEDVPALTTTFAVDGGFVAVFSAASTIHSFYTQLPLGQNPQNGDQFGAALTTADFNGDAAADLAIGTPGDAIGGDAGAGSVTVIYGILNVGLPRPQSLGLSEIPGTVHFFTQDTANIADSTAANDRFGASLTASNLGRTDHDDLVIGVPDEDLQFVSGTISGGLTIETRANAGILHVLYGAASGVQASASQLWSQNTSGVPDSVEAGDRFGATLP
jgi:hypothetical protein